MELCENTGPENYVEAPEVRVDPYMQEVVGLGNSMEQLRAELQNFGNYSRCEQAKLLAFSENLSGHSSRRLREMLTQRSCEGTFADACKRLLTLSDAVNYKVLELLEATGKKA